MTSSQLLDQVAGVMGSLFGVDTEQIVLETTRESLDGWDSLNHINLILDLESHFGIHIAETDVPELTSVSKIISVIEKQLTQSG